MGRMKDAYLDYVCNTLGISQEYACTLSIATLEQMLKELEERIQQEEERIEEKIDDALKEYDWDVDVDEDGHIFIVNAEGERA
jgi:guanylate kinase